MRPVRVLGGRYAVGCKRRSRGGGWHGVTPGLGSGVSGVAARGCGSEAMMRHRGSARASGAWTRFKRVMAVLARDTSGGVCDVAE